MRSTQADYREILKSEFSARRLANPSYSLRAFARDLQLAPPKLSQILSGSCGLSVTRARSVASRLGFSDQEISNFCDLVEARHSRSPALKIEAQARLKKLGKTRTVLELGDFSAIAHWRTFAILSLLELNNGPCTVAQIAARLPAPIEVVRDTVEKLTQFKMITSTNGRLTLVTADTLVPAQKTSSRVMRNYHAQLLDRSREALTTQPMEERDISSIVMAIDQDQLPRAKEMLKEFRSQFQSVFGSHKNKNQVYALTTHFFKLV